VIAEAPITSASAAPASGVSAARNAPPNTISRMISAAMTPTTTEGPGLARSEFVIEAPPRDTCTLGPSAVCAAAIRACVSAAVTSAGGRSQVTRAKATVPLRLTCVAPAVE
jgi:hypothetical protein